MFDKVLGNLEPSTFIKIMYGISIVLIVIIFSNFYSMFNINLKNHFLMIGCLTSVIAFLLRQYYILPSKFTAEEKEKMLFPTHFVLVLGLILIVLHFSMGKFTNKRTRSSLLGGAPTFQEKGKEWKRKLCEKSGGTFVNERCKCPEDMFPIDDTACRCRGNKVWSSDLERCIEYKRENPLYRRSHI